MDLGSNCWDIGWLGSPLGLNCWDIGWLGRPLGSNCWDIGWLGIWDQIVGRLVGLGSLWDQIVGTLVGLGALWDQIVGSLVRFGSGIKLLGHWLVWCPEIHTQCTLNSHSIHTQFPPRGPPPPASRPRKSEVTYRTIALNRP